MPSLAQRRVPWIVLATMVVAILLLRGGEVWQRVQLAGFDVQMLRYFMSEADELALLNAGGGESGQAVGETPAGTGSLVSQLMQGLLESDCASVAQLVELEEALNHSSTLLLLGECWQRMGFPDEALAVWSTVDNVSLLFFLQGQACDRMDDAECARAHYEASALTLNYADWKTLIALIRQFNRPDDVVWLEYIVTGLAEVDDAPAGALPYAEAILLSNLGQLEEAIFRFNTAIATEPDGPRVYLDAGLVASRLENFSLARSYWEKGLLANPDYEEFYLFIAQSYRQQGQLDEAFAWYSEAEGQWSAIREQAEIRFVQGRYEESLALYEEVLAIRPGAGLYAQASQAAIRAEQYETAQAWLREAIALDSQTISYRLQLGELCETVLDNPCAIEQYETILLIEPNHNEAQSRLEQLNR